MKRILTTLGIGVAAPALADMNGVPNLDVTAYCAHEPVCVQVEYLTRKKAVDHWPLLSPAARAECAKFDTYAAVDLCAQSHLRQDQR
jgi:hypothetical protein